MKADYFYLIPAILIVIIGYILRAIRWRYLVCTIKEVKTANLYSPLMIGFMANMLPARAGEFIRAYLLSKKEHIRFSASFATIFIEKLFDLLMVLLILVWVLMFMPEVFFTGDRPVSYQMIDKVKIFGITSLLLCVFIFLFSALLQYRNEWTMKMVEFFIKPFPDKWKDKIISMVHSFTDGLNIIKDKRGFISVMSLSLLTWATFIFEYYPLYLSFGIQAELPILSSLIVICLTVVIFITVMPTPGFLGSYQLGCVAALHGIFGIQKAVALSYGIVAWIVAMGSTVIIGALFAIKENISLGEVSESKDLVE